MNQERPPSFLGGHGGDNSAYSLQLTDWFLPQKGFPKKRLISSSNESVLLAFFPDLEETDHTQGVRNLLLVSFSDMEESPRLSFLKRLTLALKEDRIVFFNKLGLGCAKLSTSYYIGYIEVFSPATPGGWWCGWRWRWSWKGWRNCWNLWWSFF